MAELTLFTYRKGDSLLHLLDVRCKFILLCLTSICIFKAHFSSVFLFIFVLIFFFINCRINLLKNLSGLAFFLLLLVLMFISRSVALPGDPVFTLFDISVTKQGMTDGALMVSRFFTIMMAGILFSITTRPASLKNAIQWLLKPVPFVPEKRVAVMVSLALTFLPLILRQANQVSDAQKARLGNLNKNPVKKIVRLSIPLLKKTFVSADNLAFAMEARCYDEDRTDPEFHLSGKEGLFFIGGLVLSACLVLY
ncbi:MAG: energy-coupling factor transporter transmembrane protein EcfT [Desulfobacteraceae bacterium]|nr:energy-coupling factor transporter transmembrane protein EcfT [Desulfobacteraceae bacterium]